MFAILLCDEKKCNFIYQFNISSYYGKAMICFFVKTRSVLCLKPFFTELCSINTDDDDENECKTILILFTKN